MDATKNIERGARLGEFLDRKMLSKRDFSSVTGISPSMISFYVLGSQPFTGRLIEAITEFYPELSLDWLYYGRGEMLKHSYTAEMQEETPPVDTFFNRNLPILIRAFEMESDNLPSIIAEQSSITLNDLVNGNRGPSLRLLIRLRELWGIPIDDMLFTDLTHPGTMDDLKEKSTENLQIKQQMERLLSKMQELEARDKEREDQMKKITQKIDKSKEEDNNK